MYNPVKSIYSVLVVVLVISAFTYLQGGLLVGDFRPLESEQRFASTFGPSGRDKSESCPPRLELLHIPKTGGTTIEASATESANIAWGACHFHLNYGTRPWDICPMHLQINKTLWPRNSQFHGAWHFPLQYLELNETMQRFQLPQNPYHNLPINSTNMSLASTTCDPQKQELHFFVVVRDPFDRVLSLYYYIMALRKWPISEIIDPEWVNEWIYDKLTEFQEKAQEPPKDWKAAMLAWIPQSEFVHDGNDTKRVQHILKFENLTSEFQSLMKEYNLPIELSHQKEKSGDVPYADRISKYNLTMDNVLLIQEIYRDDFDLGGYDLLVLTNASMSEDEDASTPMDHATNITIGLEQESTYDNHKQSSDEPV